ncbi:MAG TPA: hypothetical protein VF941_07990 [Clostridia bacterium]
MAFIVVSAVNTEKAILWRILLMFVAVYLLSAFNLQNKIPDKA